MDHIRHEILPLAWANPEMRRALASRDMTEVYRRLIAAGLNQRQISQLTGQRPSEVSEVVNGRAVQSILVLERIASGLAIEPGWMGLAYTGGRSRSEGPPARQGAQEVGEDVKRRNFINAIAGAVVWGHPVLTELLTAPSYAPTPLPKSISGSDVAALRDLTERLRGLARRYGGYGDTFAAVAARADRLLAVPADEETRHALGTTIAELHTMAGWSAFDASLDDQARHHYSRAMTVAQETDNSYLVAKAIRHAAVTPLERGHYDDALKLYQLAQIKVGELPRDEPRARYLTAWLHAESASALARMDRPQLARDALSRARDGWEPPDAFERADMDWRTAIVYTELGEHVKAEPFAQGSIRCWGADERRDAAKARITLAELHLAAREPDSAHLAATAIDATDELSSARARARLAPLITALLAQRDSTCNDLARRAQAVVTEV